jgi:hypothetical protein
MSQDVVFHESRHFYPHPSIDASSISLVDSHSFLLFHDAPSIPLSISHLILPSSLVSTHVTYSSSSSMILDYTVKIPVTQIYSRHVAHLSDAIFHGRVVF